MKKIISLALLGATSLMALGAEHAYIYKDPRVMGMGGANVAAGGYSTSVFSNPAGLTQLKKDDGFIVDLLGIGVSLSSEYTKLLDDVSSVDTSSSNTNATSDMVNILQKYSGKHLHLGADNYTAIAKNSDLFAWSIGILGAVDTNLQVHANGGASFIETSSRIYQGLNLGVARPYETPYGGLDVGLNLKFISQTSYEGGLTISDLVGDNSDIAKTLQDKYEKKASGFGLDIGATFRPFEDTIWHPAFVLSILNIGSMGMDKNYGHQPMTVNLGASITPDVDFMNKLVLAIDYTDALNANKLRIYTYDANGDPISYDDYTDADFMKRLRLGASFGLINNSFFATTLNVGLYQSAYTAGIDMQLAILKLNFATYAEQIGVGSVDISDRRYMAQIGISW